MLMNISISVLVMIKNIHPIGTVIMVTVEFWSMNKLQALENKL